MNNLAKKFKQTLKNNTHDPILQGKIEIDEMYIHAGSKGIKKNEPRQRGLKIPGRGTYKNDKPPIITIVEQNTGYTIFSVERQLSMQLIRHKVRKHCEQSVTVYTDEFPIYNGLKKLLKVDAHKTVTNSSNMYADGDVHVNNCENRHSLLRPFLNMYRGVSKKNLNTYVKFFQFIYNNGVNWTQKALQIILTIPTHSQT